MSKPERASSERVRVFDTTREYDPVQWAVINVTHATKNLKSAKTISEATQAS